MCFLCCLVCYLSIVLCLFLRMFVFNVILLMCFFFKQKTAYEMRISDWSSDVCSSDLLGAKTRELDQKTSGEVERWRGRWAEMQNAARERANVPERVDHRSHQRRGIEQEATVHMGPSATAMERRAERQAMREGRAYEPVTMVGQHNAGVIEQRGLRQYIERGTEWLRDAGQRISGRLHAFAATL